MQMSRSACTASVILDNFVIDVNALARRMREPVPADILGPYPLPRARHC